jgi:VanZ family protein
MLRNKSTIKFCFYLYLLLLAFLSLLIGGQNAENNILHKLSITDSGFFLHVVAYFVASVLGVLTIAKRGLKKILLILILIFLYGYLLEILQYFFPFRTYNFNDILANGLGIVIYLLIYVSTLAKSRFSVS